MKVLMTADAMGGVWQYSVELMRALDKEGVQFALATMGASLSAEQRAQVQQLRNVELHESTFLLEWMQNPWSDVDRAGEWLLGIEQQFNPDVVHLNGFAHGALPWRTAPLVVAHSCVISWWRAVKREAAPGWLDTYREKVIAGLRGAAVVVAPTGAILETVRENYFNPSNACVIPNGRTGSLYRSAGKQRAIASVGRVWDEGKNIHALARVGGDLGWRVFLAGDAAGQKVVTPENVHVLGMLPEADIAAMLARAEIYALPARYEPFGLSVLEAAYSECALVLGDISTLRENWDGAALFVDPHDDDALRDALLRVIGDAVLRRKLQHQAAERAQQFTPARMAAAYLSTYIELSLPLRSQPCAS